MSSGNSWVYTTFAIELETQRPLARSVNRHCLYQRPVDVILTIFHAVVRSQEHLAPIMSPSIPFQDGGSTATRRSRRSRLQTQHFLRTRPQNL